MDRNHKSNNYCVHQIKIFNHFQHVMSERKESKQQASDHSSNETEHEYYLRVTAEAKRHPPTHDCPENECDVCAFRDCPMNDVLHYACSDGCPSCNAMSTHATVQHSTVQWHSATQAQHQ